MRKTIVASCMKPTKQLTNRMEVRLISGMFFRVRKKAIRPDMTVPVQKMHSQVRTFHHWSNAYTVIQSLRKQPLTSQISKFLFAVCVSCFHICGSVFVHPGKIFFRGFLNLTPHRILSIIFKATFINKALLTSGCSEKWPPLFSLEM